MTRINSSINVKCLTDEHLLAEHREIKRICDNFLKRFKINKFNDIPKEFTLGCGHVLYFIDKPAFTFSRYTLIHDECKHRKFNVEDYSKNWDVYPNNFKLIRHKITERENDSLIERITKRLQTSTKLNWKYYGSTISSNKAIQILNKNDFNVVNEQLETMQTIMELTIRHSLNKQYLFNDND